jgi:hypothetical protein
MAPQPSSFFLNPSSGNGDYRRLVIYDRETMVKVGDQLRGVLRMYIFLVLLH